VYTLFLKGKVFISKHYELLCANCHAIEHFEARKNPVIQEKGVEIKTRKRDALREGGPKHEVGKPLQDHPAASDSGQG
jgi:hypothetical protein